MSLSELLRVITDDPQLKRALSEAEAPASAGADLIAPPALRPFLAAALAGSGDAGRFVLAVTATAREAEELTAALGSLLPGTAAAYFPPCETLPHERLPPRSDTSGQRLAVLRRLAHPDPADPRSGPLTVVATPARCLLQPMVGGLGELEPVRVREGEAAGLDDLVSRLVGIGGARRDLGRERGELAVGGRILDVFPPTQEHPPRTEFFGDTVAEIPFFRAPDQPRPAG